LFFRRLVHTDVCIHYRNQSLCRVPEALGEALKTLSKEDSAKSASAKASLPSAFSQALGKPLCRVPESIRQRKVAVTAPGDGDGDFAECCLEDTRQRSYLCRVSSRQHSAKSPPERVPMSGSLSSVLCGTRQSRPLCRVPAT
jgi:hypothetical protein